MSSSIGRATFPDGSQRYYGYSNTASSAHAALFDTEELARVATMARSPTLNARGHSRDLQVVRTEVAMGLCFDGSLQSTGYGLATRDHLVHHAGDDGSDSIRLQLIGGVLHLSSLNEGGWSGQFFEPFCMTGLPDGQPENIHPLEVGFTAQPSLCTECIGRLLGSG